MRFIFELNEIWLIISLIIILNIIIMNIADKGNRPFWHNTLQGFIKHNTRWWAIKILCKSEFKLM